MEHGGPRDHQGILSVIKISGRVLHVMNRPARDLRGHGKSVRGVIGKIREGFDCLRGARNVDGIRSIVIIARAAGCTEECRPEVLEAKTELWSECCIAGAFDVALEAVEI